MQMFFPSLRFLNRSHDDYEVVQNACNNCGSKEAIVFLDEDYSDETSLLVCESCDYSWIEPKE